MADAFLVAVAAASAADHERISKFCLDRLRGIPSRSQRYIHFRHRVQPPTLMGLQSLGNYNALCLLMGVIFPYYRPYASYRLRKLPGAKSANEAFVIIKV